MFAFGRLCAGDALNEGAYTALAVGEQAEQHPESPHEESGASAA